MLQRVKVLPAFVEFFGSMTLAMALLAMSGRTSFPFYGAVIAGLVYGLFVLITWPTYKVQINPIVTLGMWTLRLIGSVQAAVAVLAQLLGGVVAWQLSEFLLDQPLRNVAGDQLDWRVLLAEALGAAIFTFVLAAVIAGKRESTMATAAFTAGAGLAAGMLVASLASNGLINPAAAIGLQSWSWTYVLGPVAGALVGMNLMPILLAVDSSSGKKTASARASDRKATVKRKSKTAKRKK